MALAGGGERVAFASLIWICLGKWIQTLISSGLSKHEAVRHVGGEGIQGSVETLWKAIHHSS